MGEPDARYERGLAKLAEYTLPGAGATHAKIAEDLDAIAPDLGRYIAEFAYGDIYSRPGLDNQRRALVTLSSLVTQGTDPQVELHVNTALTVGLTANEVVEALLQLLPYTGFPRVINALTIAKRVFAQRDVTP